MEIGAGVEAGQRSGQEGNISNPIILWNAAKPQLLGRLKQALYKTDVHFNAWIWKCCPEQACIQVADFRGNCVVLVYRSPGFGTFLEGGPIKLRFKVQTIT